MTSGPAPASEWAVTPAGIAVSVARHWRAVAGVPLIGGLLVVALLLVWPPTYTSSATLVPELRQGATNQLAGLAAIIGVLPAAGGGQQSSQFYADLLRSRPVVYGVLQSRFADPRPRGGGGRPDAATLLDIMEVKAQTQNARLQRASEVLLGKVQVSVDVRTGVIALSVENRYPTLAMAIVSSFIAQLDIYNRDVRQSQARARRMFTEQQALESQRRLTDAEDLLRRFLEQNRSFQSPSLQFERDRFERRVSTAQELYLNLQRQSDVARIDEVNDLPVITVIERPVVPSIRTGPRRRVLLTVFLVFAAAATVAGVVGYDVGGKRLSGALGDLRSQMRPHLPGPVARWV